MDIEKCFEILELSSNASFEEVRSSYRDLVQVWHPDRFSNSTRLYERATEKLKRINKAYEDLSDHFLKGKVSQSQPSYENEKSDTYSNKDSTAFYNDSRLFNEISSMMLECVTASKFKNSFSVYFDKNRDLWVTFVITNSTKFSPDVIAFSEKFLLGFEPDVKQKKIDSLISSGWQYITLRENNYYYAILGVFGKNESNTLHWARFVFSTITKILEVSPNRKFYIEIE